MKELVDYARIIYPNPLNEKTIIEVIYEDQFSYENMGGNLGEYYQDVILEKKENGVIIFQGKKIRETIQKKGENLNDKHYTIPLYNYEIIVRNSDSTTLNS